MGANVTRSLYNLRMTTEQVMLASEQLRIRQKTTIVTNRVIGFKAVFSTDHVVILAVAWLVIALMSRLIRNRAFRTMVAAVVWSWVALVVLNIHDDVARHQSGLLGRASFADAGEP